VTVVVVDFFDLAFLKPASSSKMFPRHYCSRVRLGMLSIWFNKVDGFGSGSTIALGSKGFVYPSGFYEIGF
jgi:hypothetical protein